MVLVVERLRLEIKRPSGLVWQSLSAAQQPGLAILLAKSRLVPAHTCPGPGTAPMESRLLNFKLSGKDTANHCCRTIDGRCWELTQLSGPLLVGHGTGGFPMPLRICRGLCESLHRTPFPIGSAAPSKPLITTHLTWFYQVKDVPRELKPPWPSSRASTWSSLSPYRPHICDSCQPLPQQSSSLTNKLTHVVSLHHMITKEGRLHVTPVCSLLLQHTRERLWGTARPARPASLLRCPPTLPSGKNVRPDSQRASEPGPQMHLVCKVQPVPEKLRYPLPASTTEGPWQSQG